MSNHHRVFLRCFSGLIFFNFPISCLTFTFTIPKTWQACPYLRAFEPSLPARSFLADSHIALLPLPSLLKGQLISEKCLMCVVTTAHPLLPLYLLSVPSFPHRLCHYLTRAVSIFFLNYYLLPFVPPFNWKVSKMSRNLVCLVHICNPSVMSITLFCYWFLVLLFYMNEDINQLCL